MIAFLEGEMRGGLGVSGKVSKENVRGEACMSREVSEDDVSGVPSF